MNSAITITQYKNNLTGSCEGRKVAKLFQGKVNTMANEYYNQLLSNMKNEFASVRAEITDMFDLSYSSQLVDEEAKLSSARKLKINNPKNLFNNCCDEYNKNVESKVRAKRNTFKIDKDLASNGIQFPNAKREEIKEIEGTTLYNNPVENPKEATVFRNEVNGGNSFSGDTTNAVNNTSANSLSRLSRMDYNASAAGNGFERNETPVRDTNAVSIDDYLQNGKIKSNNYDLEALVESNERLNNEINESQKILKQLEVQLTKLKEISEAKRQARISELKEENLSKTATLNGLAEQIRVLEEAIRLEQQTVSSEGSIRRF